MNMGGRIILPLFKGGLMKDLRIWQREFKTREEYEIARLKIMIELTERAIGPDPMPSSDFLVKQKSRLEQEVKKLKLKLQTGPKSGTSKYGRNNKPNKKAKKKATKKATN